MLRTKSAPAVNCLRTGQKLVKNGKIAVARDAAVRAVARCTTQAIPINSGTPSNLPTPGCLINLIQRPPSLFFRARCQQTVLKDAAGRLTHGCHGVAAVVAAAVRDGAPRVAAVLRGCVDIRRRLRAVVQYLQGLHAGRRAGARGDARQRLERVVAVGETRGCRRAAGKAIARAERPLAALFFFFAGVAAPTSSGARRRDSPLLSARAASRAPPRAPARRRRRLRRPRSSA